MANKQIILLDGGMGQELVARTKKPITPMWSAQILLDEPDIVEGVHRSFIDAGACVITLNSYALTPQRLKRDGDTNTNFDDLQARAGALAAKAREESGADVALAGCLPPLVASYKPELSPSFAECVASYRQIVAAQDPYVDVFICETMSSLKEAKAALKAGKESGKPVWVGLSVDDWDGSKLRSGEPVQAVVAALKTDQPDIILINCSSPEAINSAIPELVKSGTPFGAYANGFTSIKPLKAGGTVEGLQKRDDLGPEAYAKRAMRWVNQGATVIGGCCEVGPQHIQKLAEELRERGFELVSKLEEYA